MTENYFQFSFSSRWHHSARKGPYALRRVSLQSPQGCPRNSANICLVEYRSFSTLEGGMSAASFLHSSRFQAIDAVILKPVQAYCVQGCCVSTDDSLTKVPPAIKILSCPLGACTGLPCPVFDVALLFLPPVLPPTTVWMARRLRDSPLEAGRAEMLRGLAGQRCSETW